ncbi:unnamed protein product [Calypogeia fissa]
MHRDFNKLVQSQKKEPNDELYSSIYQKFEVPAGVGRSQSDLLMTMQSKNAVNSSTGDIIRSFSLGSPLRDKERSTLGQNVVRTGKIMSKGKVPNEPSAVPGLGEQKGVILYDVSEKSRDFATDHEEEATISSFLMGTSPVDEQNFFGSDLLVDELQKTSDAFEEMEGRVQVKLMVGEAVLKGMLTAMEREATEAVETKEAELQKVRDQLQEKESIVNRLIFTLQSKEDEMAKLVEESNQKERRLVLCMLTERERVLAKVKESEKFMATKEDELLKMAEDMEELAKSLDGGSKKVEELKGKIRELRASKGTEVKVLMEKCEQFRSQKDSAVETVRREDVLGELRLTDSLVKKDTLPTDQMQKLRHLESAEQQLREALHVHKEEVSQLMQSNQDDSVLLKKRKLENKSAADELDSTGRMTSMQGDMDLLKNRILELIIENSMLVNELSCQKAEIGATVNEHRQEYGLQDEEIHHQAVSNSEQHLRQELMRMRATLQEYVQATQSLKTNMEDQRWMHEFETGLIIEALKGKVLDLIEEIHLLEDDSAGNQREKTPFGSRMQHKNRMELVDLQSSKSEFQESVTKLNAVTRDFKQIMEEDKNSDGEAQMLKKTQNGISPENQSHLQLHNNHSAERKLQESVKNNQKMLEENAQILREAQNRISFLEHELAVKEGLLQTCKLEMEEQSWRSEFEAKLLSTYFEDSFRECLKHTAEVQGNLVDVGQKLVSGQNELEAAQDELIKCKAEVDILKSAVEASSNFVDQLQAEAKSYVSNLAQVRVELQDARSEFDTEKVSFCEKHEEMNSRTMELEDNLLKKREEVVELLRKLEESDWRSQSQTAIIFGLVEGSTQECAVEFARLREELKLKHQEVLSLRAEVEEQNERLNSHVSDVCELTTALVGKDHDLHAFREGAESTSVMQRDALLQEQETVRGALKEIEDLKKVKMTLVGRIEEEKQRVKQLEDELAEQNWKKEVELEMVATVFWEGKPNASVTWNKESGGPPGEAQSPHGLARQEPTDKKSSVHSSRVHGHDGLNVESLHVPVQDAATKSEAPDVNNAPTVEAEPVALLERQVSELRREKEKLLEEKTDEIYKLKREYYKGFERFKEEWKSDNERRWDDGKASFMELTFQRDEGIEGRDEKSIEVPKKMGDALEKERTHSSSKVSLVESLGALEKERSRLNSVHEREKEKLVAYYKKLLEEKESAISGAFEEIAGSKKRVGELEVECSLSKDEIEVLRIEMGTIQKHFKRDFEQMQCLMASYEQLENRASHKINQYNIRLEAAQGLVNHLLRQYSVLPLSETEYLQNVQNLQKAEAEVDMLGDEVDALMDILEKVYSVLNHYSPIIQHYPGLAELVKVVRHEILQRINDPKEG